MDPAGDERTMTDEVFLRHCTLAVFRASGPGGQKRNKTSSAVRLTHVPTGVAAEASESRSQAKNRDAALRRLRLRVVLARRRPAPLDATAAEFAAHGRWHWPAASDPRFWSAVGLLVDVLEEEGYSLSAAAEVLNVSSASLARAIKDPQEIGEFVNTRRAQRGLKGLGLS